jgi:hypothetical protein
LGAVLSSVGVAVIPGWLAVLILLIVRLLPQQPLGFIITLNLWSAIYVLICYTKGEPMPRRSDNDNRVAPAGHQHLR